MLTSVRVLSAIVRPELRASRTLPVLCGTLCAVAVAAVPLLSSVHPDTEAAAVLLRASAVFAASGLAFLLDDPAARTTEVAPTPCLARQGVRLVAGGLTAAVGWAVAAVLTRAAMHASSGLPVTALAVEASTISLLTVLLTLLGLRFTAGQSGSLLAAPGVIVLVAILVALPHSVALFVSPTAAGWQDAVMRWRVLGVVTVGICLWLLRNQPRGPVFRQAARITPARFFGLGAG